MRTLRDFPRRTPFASAPRSAREARAALRVQECLVSPERAPACVVVGGLASVDAPVAGLVSISTHERVLLTKCDAVEHLWRLLSETPIFAVVLPDVVLDQIKGATWLWQGEPTEAS